MKAIKPDIRLNDFMERCRLKGMRVTGQRMEIYRAIAEGMDHPSAEMVYQVVKKRMPAISLDTVYRTLDTLEEFGLIWRVEAVNTKAQFDANPIRHHHFLCIKCGRVIDVPCLIEDGAALWNKLSHIGVVEAINLQIRGTCAKCKEDHN